MSKSDDELLIVTALDQPIPSENGDILAEIEQVITSAVEHKDVYIALDYLKQIIKLMKAGGLALAKGLYLIQRNWSEFEISENEEFDWFVFDYLGLHNHTVERYLKVWGMFAEGKAPERIAQRNIKELIPIANAIAQGYEIKEEHWKEIEQASDYNEVAKIIRDEVKKEEPRKTGLFIYLDNDGILSVWQNEKRYFVGTLEVESNEEPVKKAIERLTKNAGVLRG